MVTLIIHWYPQPFRSDSALTIVHPHAHHTSEDYRAMDDVLIKSHRARAHKTITLQNLTVTNHTSCRNLGFYPLAHDQMIVFVGKHLSDRDMRRR